MPGVSVKPGFHQRTVGEYSFQVFVPKGYTSGKSWPCIVFLHGVGENGTDGRKHMKIGLPKHVRENADTFPAIVVCPQNPGPWKFKDEREEMVLDALAQVQEEFNIDEKRLYLTGLSQGGCSTFDIGAKTPGRWAALVVVCGAGKPEDAPKLEEVPIWIFHGGKDWSIPPSGSHKFDKVSIGGRDMHERIRGSKYTEYPRDGHYIWDKAYGDAKLWKWLFAQKLK